MESIHIVGGLKTEPFEIQYLPPSDGASIEITLKDIADSDDEKENYKETVVDLKQEISSCAECYVISEDSDAEVEGTHKTIPFKYVGNNHTGKNSHEENEKCIFNYTKNEDLFVINSSLTAKTQGTENTVEANDVDSSLNEAEKHDTPDNSTLQIEDVNQISDDDDEATGTENIENSVSEADKNISMKKSTSNGSSYQENQHMYKSKNNLHKAVLNEDISDHEYQTYMGQHYCNHCGFQDTLENIKIHIIKNHRKTALKQCPHCNVQTKVLLFHLKTVHGEPTDVHKPDSRKSKINLEEAVYKEDISSYEYKEKRGRYICLHCRNRFTLDNVKTHIIENHRKTALKQCLYCDVQTKVLKYHERMFHKNQRKCKECNFETRTTQKLKEHIARRHQKSPNMVKCDECPKEYKNKYSLENHVTKMHKNAPYQCAQCDYKTRCKKHLRFHMEYHRNSEELPTLHCDQCAYQTKYNKLLYYHQIRHQPKTKKMYTYCCDRCGYLARDKFVLQRHMNKNHDKEKDYRCDKCSFKTHRKNNLQIHKLNHLKPKETEYFYCYHCDYKSNRKDFLKNHIFRHFKKEEVAFKCFICDFTINKRHLLIRHIDEHAKENS